MYFRILRIFFYFSQGKMLITPLGGHPTTMKPQKFPPCVWRCISRASKVTPGFAFSKIHHNFNKIWSKDASSYVMWVFPEMHIWNIPWSPLKGIGSVLMAMGIILEMHLQNPSWFISEQHHCPNIIICVFQVILK